METYNNPYLVSTIKAVEMEFKIALFYMEYLAFGFMFSGSMSELMELSEDISAVKVFYGYLHQN